MMAVAYLPTAGELVDGVLSLIAVGIVVPVWDHECNDVGLWPAADVPPDVEPMDIDEVRAHFRQVAENLLPRPEGTRN